MVHAGWGQWFARNAPGMRSPAPQKTTMGRPNGVGHESTGRDGGEKSMGPSSAGKRASTPRAAAGAARSARTPETPAIPASLQRFAIQCQFLHCHGFDTDRSYWNVPGGIVAKIMVALCRP